MFQNVLKTRIILWKKQPLSIIFWLIIPIMGTLLITHLTDILQDDTKVPVGIVIEDDSELANNLVRNLESSSFIQVTILSKEEALFRLTKHELDSVFVIQKNYGRNIKQNNRNKIVTSYYTKLSFAYPTIKEMVISNIQQMAGRSKTVQTVQLLADHYNVGHLWTWEEIIEDSILIEKEQDLLITSFVFDTSSENSDETTDNISLINGWNIWAILVLLATLLLFDWPSKEVHSKIQTRFIFIKMGFKKYLMVNLLIYILLFMLVDFMTVFLFQNYMNVESLLSQFGVIFSFRIFISIGAFLLSLLFKKVYSYYLISFMITLLFTISSGLILPLDGLFKHFKLISWMNPLYTFNSKQFNIHWILIISCFIIIWLFRKERTYATS